ncbi:SAM-dependent methyltransferase [Cryobacterium mesophilum]|uniref:Methyltransferase domain-containing protein n=1 Tax=Terrimesophilobacter mesophilus TaxID=433647 RepID=A0A4R8V835_9MICO|nr:class I SAM-dependent methyltransferase [Terrimesophilobacter mesophilus]MBB5631918.1 SAM-dependent methyltransferase [Terrimesophilobacter mesophilus]TFB78823.1 methyltransferase domain-containing protein [Terrimesophilobacter mesophilus]
MSDISWTAGSRPVTCRMCTWTGDGTHLATIDVAGGEPIQAVACLRCGSVQLVDEPHPSSSTEASVDDYIEVGGGVGTIAEYLTLVDPRRVHRFLDIGCGYGFSLDLGRAIFGWDVLGVEPSIAGSRGAAELNLDIRKEYLTEVSDLGTDFDLIFSSEVLEHVTDPIGFLVAIRERLSPTGHLVLTTPAAEILSPDEPYTEAFAAVSAGYHVFLASEEGLHIALSRAGFPFSKVIRSGGTLKAIARLQELDDDTPAPVSADQLQDYFEELALRTDPATPLGVGMATRFLRLAVARGDFRAAERAVPLVVSAFSARHGVRLDDPGSLESSRGGPATLWSLPGAAFALGMLDLLHRSNPQRASEYFSVVTHSARAWRELAGVPDLDIVDLIYQGEYHRLIALARFDAQAASVGALTLRNALHESARGAEDMVRIGQVRIFVETVAHGTSDQAGALIPLVTAGVGVLAASSDMVARTAGLDGMYSLGVAAVRMNQPGTAHYWLARCRTECAALGPADTHAVALMRLCGGVLPSVVRTPAVPPDAMELVPLPPLHSMIDLYWCDASGTFLQGWAHAENLRVDSITVRGSGSTVTTTRHDRDDLLPFWPDEPEVVHGGFRVYLPGPPNPTVTITAHTRQGPVTQVIELPDHPLPAAPDSAPLIRIQERVVAAVQAAPPGPVLAIGVRALSRESLEAQLPYFAGREVIGLDIHPGIGVDVVGDAHVLSELFPKGHFAIVYSASLLEHVGTPWLVAAQCGVVTMQGGVNIHQAPWLWPTHSAPNDFWRFSPAGLEQLFSPELGFHTMFSAAFGEASVTPHGGWRDVALNMPTLYSGAASWIIAQKISDAADAAGWPLLSGSSAETARKYPTEGLADASGQS